MRRTRIQDHEQIEKADDLEKVVKDKRQGKRGNKQKAQRRNRHYQKVLLKKPSQGVDHNAESD